MSLTSQILLQIAATELTVGDLATTTRSSNVSQSISWTDGTGSGQAEVTWSDSRTLGPQISDAIELEALTDERGTTTLTTVRAIYIRNTGPTLITWAGINDWTDGPLANPLNGQYRIPPGGVWLAVNPAGSWTAGDQMTINNISTTESATYDILLIGTTS